MFLGSVVPTVASTQSLAPFLGMVPASMLSQGTNHSRYRLRLKPLAASNLQNPICLFSSPFQDLSHQQLVCNNRSERCVLSYRHPARTQEIPQVLPFSLVLSSCKFTKCMDATLASLCLQGICILNYTGEWLILAQLKDMVARHWDLVLLYIL